MASGLLGSVDTCVWRFAFPHVRRARADEVSGRANDGALRPRLAPPRQTVALCVPWLCTGKPISNGVGFNLIGGDYLSDQAQKRVIQIELILPDERVDEGVRELRRTFAELGYSETLEISLSPAPDETRARSEVKVTRLQ